MKTVRRLFYVDIVSSVAFVSLAFLSLFYFIDFVDALSDSAKRGSSVLAAAMACLLEVPGHFYELAPITVLIGTIYALSRLAQSSEFTILRTGGLGPGRALRLLATLGLSFGALTFFIGDYLAPLAENRAVQLKALARGGIALGRSGTWLKDRQTTAEGERSYSINVARTGTKGEMLGVKIFEFDGDARLVRQVAAESGVVEGQSTWTLSNVTLTRWIAAAGSQPPQVITEKLPRWQWNGGLSADVVASALLPLATMSTLELWRYIGHLDTNEQAAQAYEIQFWKRALYPFACLVMVGLALPFAYLHARAGGISLKVFGGIMLGITFMLLNSLAGHLGLLRNWTPWIVAAAPSALFLLMSMAAFAWLVRYR
ncbi:MAG: LPS export ABC transporter permease LptG [Rhizobacter sp.]